MTRRLADFAALKQQQQPICMLTCYSYPTARQLDAAGIDIALVGDSLGTTLLGYETTQSVTMDDMCSHVAAVKRGCQRAYILADMPYQSYTRPQQALENAQRLIAAGAAGVKLEGPLIEIIAYLTSHDIDVCAHLGYLPQSAQKPGVVGRQVEAAQQLLADARSVEAAGAAMLVLELVPAELSAVLSHELRLPTIGIGAGAACDGQVQVIDDLLGISERVFKHAHRYAMHRDQAIAGIKQYGDEVRARDFPGAANASHVDEAFIEQLKKTI